MTETPAVDTTAAWAALSQHVDEIQTTDLRRLFEIEGARADRLTLPVGSLTVDFSKNLVTSATISLLSDLAEQAGLAERRQAMFSGQRINNTEDRPALHTALRAVDPVLVDGANVVPAVRDVVDRMGIAADKIRNGTWLGATGQPIRTVVNLGIGGSDLGPVMATRALRHLVPPELDVRFVSNVDGAHLDAALTGLSAETTLFVVASKSFTTIETMTNARSARAWLLAGLSGFDRANESTPESSTAESAVARHFVALSTNGGGVQEFGIDPANMFEFWDWVGGRYSVDSACGFSLMCAIGSAGFEEFLAGFRTMDDHFRHAPFAENGPVLAALIGIWYRNFLGWATHAILPYSQALERFPAYLQQLDMESNGKQTSISGEPVGYDTAPVIWGEPGTNGQHSFFQMLHQGTTSVPCDLIGFIQPEPTVNPGIDRSVHHRLLFANMVAQAEALAFGRSAQEVAAAGVAPALVAHRTFPGNRPSTVITADALTPGVLGELIAFYEHRVFTQGAVWGVNSFDQWGVELGKVLATEIGAELESGVVAPGRDASTTALIQRFRDSQT